MSPAAAAIYYIGPESVVYHERPNCPALRSPWRYYETRQARGTEAVKVRAERRPCKRCAS